MKFISTKTNQVYDLPICLMVKVPDALKQELADETGRFKLQVAECLEVDLIAVQQPWGQDGWVKDGDWECEVSPGGLYNV